MNVVCSKCGKEYRLDFETLPAPRPILQSQEPSLTLSANAKGWLLSCYNCHHQWWHAQTTTEPAISPYRNLTNLSALREPTPTSTQRFLGDSSISFHASTDHEESSPVRSHPRPPEKKRKWFLLIAWGIVLFLILSIIGVYLIPSLSNKELFQAPIPPRVEKSAAATIAKNPLVIQNVKYGLQPLSEQEKQLVILGEISNPNTYTLPLRSLRVRVYGNCHSPGENTPQGQCTLTEWNYTWEKPQITAGETLYFQTQKEIPVNQTISRVEVTLP